MITNKRASPETDEVIIMTTLNFEDLENEEEERKNYHTVLTCFRQYKRFSNARIDKTEMYLNTLDESHQDMLSKYRNHLTKIRNCINSNYNVIKLIIKNADQLFTETESMSNKHEDGHATSKVRVQQDLENTKIESFKLLKVQTTLKLIARDWSSDGEAERKQCYQPIIDEILNYYNPETCDVKNIKILVPGAGLGRLLYELACKGYNCEGNEISLFMLLASNFCLNPTTDQPMQYTIYPWIHHYVNNLNRSDQVAAVTFPDVNPRSRDVKGNLTIAAGEFTQAYTTYIDYFDCVATCFFIDCAHNVIEFIETIYRILSPGSIWVNLGPLLYHFSDIKEEDSIEPTYEDLLEIMKKVGFKILKTQTGIRTKYAQNPQSMMKSEYESILWVCIKPCDSPSLSNK